jgi:hypothetical protein
LSTLRVESSTRTPDFLPLMRFPYPAEYCRRSRTGYSVPRSLPGVHSFRWSPSRSSGVRLHRFTLTCSGSSSHGLQALFRDPLGKPPISHAAGEPTTWDPSSSHEVFRPSSVHHPISRLSDLEQQAASNQPPGSTPDRHPSSAFLRPSRV